MRSDVNKQCSVRFDERENDSTIVIDAKSPELLQLSRQLMRSKPRIEGIFPKYRDPIPEPLFGFLVAANSALLMLCGRRRSGQSQSGEREFIRFSTFEKDSSLPSRYSSRLASAFSRIVRRRSSIRHLRRRSCNFLFQQARVASRLRRFLQTPSSDH